MEHATEVSIIRELLRQLDEKVNLDAGCQVRNPGQVYTDPAIAEREWRELFAGHPQVIGLSGDLPEPGAFITVDDFGMPLLATRDEQGRLRVFLNACRHRGVQVATEARGKRKHFTCPFHAWTYSTEGNLLRVPRSRDFGPVPPDCNKLRELPATECAGLLWVSPCGDGHIDAEALLGPLARELEGLGIADMAYQESATIDMPLNWKLANDTFGESYHIARLHRDTLSQLFHGDALAYETFGRNHRFVLASRQIDNLRQRPEREWRIHDAALLVYYLFPNIQLTVSHLGANLVRIYPGRHAPGSNMPLRTNPGRTNPGRTNPGQSVTRISCYYRASTLQALAAAGNPRVCAANAYDVDARHGSDAVAPEATMEVFRSTIEAEDYAMGASTQRALQSGLLDSLLFGRNEAPLHHFHRCFSDALGLPPPTVLDDNTPSDADAAGAGIRAATAGG
jgi:phenylpropionate dioxygenase-like ring-hydroxylating dioxygenase large terminal subunit